MDHQINTTNMADSVDGVKGDVIKQTLFQYFRGNASIKVKLDGLYYDQSIMLWLLATTASTRTSIKREFMLDADVGHNLKSNLNSYT